MYNDVPTIQLMVDNREWSQNFEFPSFVVLVYQPLILIFAVCFGVSYPFWVEDNLITLNVHHWLYLATIGCP